MLKIRSLWLRLPLLAVLIAGAALIGCNPTTDPEVPSMLVMLEHQVVLVAHEGIYAIGPVVSSRDVPILVQNLGTEELTIGEVTISGDEEFSIKTQPDSPLELDEYSRIVVAFEKAGEDGPRQAKLTVKSNDYDQPEFSFTITGTTVTATPDAPEIYMDYENPIYITTQQITDGDTAIALGYVGGTYPEETLVRFNVDNTGYKDLELEQVIVENADDGITVASNIIKDVLVPEDTTSFIIKFLKPASASPGDILSATVKIVNNDADESDFDFEVIGSVN